ncbi:MAG TPA: respiratory nitrate reductase subunit gamma [Solirubrobacterales bacterium]|nr:respiratory nitrate reductase subunit gamma [Solirubrobacterales bacterium]
MSGGALLVWVAIPYACITVFVVGHVWRYRTGKLTWTTRSTQLLERRLLKIGALLFHLGLLAVIGGHVLGILVPEAATEALGVSEGLYHAVSVTAGTSAGLAMTAGFAILLYRRTRVPRVRRTTTNADRATYALLALVIATGMWATVGINLFGGGYDYRQTVGPWFRGLFLFNPDPSLMSGAPLVYQVHALSAMALYALWPFSRLVHAWSVPIAYLRRSPILYRRRAPIPVTASQLQPEPRRIP